MVISRRAIRHVLIENYYILSIINIRILHSFYSSPFSLLRFSFKWLPNSVVLNTPVCLSNMPFAFRMILPRHLTPEDGSFKRPLGWGTPMSIPCGLMKQLPPHGLDSNEVHEKGELLAFTHNFPLFWLLNLTPCLNQLVTKYKDLERERSKLRSKIREIERKQFQISREMCVLEAHPSDWIKLNFEEVGHYMPLSVRGIMDLVGQGAKIFGKKVDHASS